MKCLMGFLSYYSTQKDNLDEDFNSLCRIDSWCRAKGFSILFKINNNIDLFSEELDKIISKRNLNDYKIVEIERSYNRIVSNTRSKKQIEAK